VTDGSLLWEKRFRVEPYGLGRSTSHDKASPVVDEERVYLTWVSANQYHVAALDRRSGEELWKCRLGPFEGEHGAGASPIRFGDLLIVPNDQAGPSSTLALNCETGETQWRVDRRSVNTAFSTPAIYRPKSSAVQLILAATSHGVSSFDPNTGKLNWELPDVFGTIRVTGSPVVAGGLIFAQCGVGGAGKRMVAIRPPDPAAGEPAEVAYEVEGSIPYVPTPVAYGNWLFVWSDSGIVSCIDTLTGERVWRERVGGSYFGSPVVVGDRIYCISREGEVVVVGAQEKFQLLGRMDLEEASHSTPAVANGVMYLRTFSHLMALGGDSAPRELRKP
jgi:outer membrane protein assembly factor BamB